MYPKEKLKNDFLIILAIGLLFNYGLYLWFGSLDIIDELFFNIPDRFYMDFDLQLQFWVMLGTLTVFIAFIIEVIRIRCTSLVMLAILSGIQLILAIQEFLYWLNPGVYAGIDYPIIKIFLDLIQLILLVGYLQKSRNIQKNGKIFLKVILFLIIFGIGIIILFIITDPFIPNFPTNAGITPTVNILLVLVSSLMILPGLIPIGVLSYIQPVSQMNILEQRKKERTVSRNCPKCGTINDINDLYCMECGFDLD